MYQTIIQFNQYAYPFDSFDHDQNLQLQTLVDCNDSSQFIQYKTKFQQLKCLNTPYLIKLNQIFQQGLIIHLVFEPISTSLRAYAQKTIEQCDKEKQLTFKKQIIKNVAFQLSGLVNFLCNHRIFTQLNYSGIGIQKQTELNSNIRLKFYIGTQFQFTQHRKNDLNDYYLAERKKILNQLECDLQIQKRTDCLPNFIIKGNRVIFTDDLSQTKTEKKNQSPKKSQYANGTYNGRRNKSKYGKTDSKQKPKKHKYSCNFQQQNLNFEYDQQKLNKSFESEKDNYSITKTRSMKIEMEHQMPNQKNRKNSVKFKITTFQQISIDQQLNQGQFDGNFDCQGNPQFNPQFFTTNDNQQSFDKNDEINRNRQTNNREDKKDYKQKVKQAKQRAQNLLNKYMKSRNKYK